MNLVVNTEAHFSRGPDGVIRSPAANSAYASWTPYRDVATAVHVIARVSPSAVNVGHAVEGPGVTVAAVPGYAGMLGTLTSPLRTYVALRPVLSQADALYLVRLPSILGGVLIAGLRLRRRPYAVEMIGDPFEVLRSGIVPKPLGIVASYFFLTVTRWQCRGAKVANYVTGRTLQARYPALNALFVSSVSDVQIPVNAFATAPRSTLPQGQLTLAMVGTMSQPYKGHFVILEAMRRLHDEGQHCRLLLAGGGRLETDLRRRVDALGLDAAVDFLGQLSSEEVRTVLDRADLFVLPSLTEGMPRALIEAMARGLPCVASSVGGVPELLDPDQLAPPGDAARLAQAIGSLLSRSDDYVAASERNIQRARDFQDESLLPQRAEFMTHLTRMHYTEATTL